MISVCIPVGPGRDDNLRLALYALEIQTYRDFEVVIGTNADSLDWVEKEYPFAKVHKVERAGRINLGGINRNYAAKVANGDHIVFIDSDVVLCKEALQFYAEDWTNFSERVIIAPYDWWPPMRVTKEDVKEWDNLSKSNLPRLTQYAAHNIKPDGRRCWHNSPDLLFCDYPSCLSMLSGNMGISKRMFEYIGGFDEELPRAEDGPFGIACVSAGFSYSYDGRIKAGHLFHERVAASIARDPFPRIIARWHSDDSWIGRRTWGKLTDNRRVMK